jgi:hypothetical protein
MKVPFHSRSYILALALVCSAAAQNQTSTVSDTSSWKFAASGDSRNCGDVVMPAIADSVLKDGAAFYWHLGDYRAIYVFDEDYLRLHPQSAITDYLSGAWPDFIHQQLKPFGNVPVFLAPGNHELYASKTRPQLIAQFADWYDSPVIRQQRLADNPDDHMVKTYYHWIDRGIDFISLDNAGPEQFDADQMAWFTAVLTRDTTNPAIRTVVLGMHAALPDSTSAGHSMNDSQQEQYSGRQVYSALVNFRRTTHKNVYVLASHSHYVMNNIYATACHAKDEVLPGWIVGSAGAVRYRLPGTTGEATIAQTDVYGYVLATIAPDATISFEFKPVIESQVPGSVVDLFGKDQVHWCFDQNKSPYQVPGPACPISCCAH